MSSKHKTSLYVDANDWKKLQEVSKQTLIPVSALVNKAIRDLLQTYSKKKS